MTTQNGGETAEKKTAAERIEEARQLHRTIEATLKTVLDLVQAGEFKDLDLLPRQVSRLTDVIADIRKKESDFHDRFGEGHGHEEVDFDVLRRDIGCRIRRIRKCCRSQSVSEKLDE